MRKNCWRSPWRPAPTTSNATATTFAVTCDPAIYREVGKALADAGMKPETAEITRLPKNTVDLDADNARKVLKLMERLDDHDDVQNVASNFNIPDEVMAEIGEE